MPIFRVKSVKIYTGQKNLHRRRRPRRRQLSGMCIIILMFHLMHPIAGFNKREEGVLQTLSTEQRRESDKKVINCFLEFVCSMTNIRGVNDA